MVIIRTKSCTIYIFTNSIMMGDCLMTYIEVLGGTTASAGYSMKE